MNRLRWAASCSAAGYALAGSFIAALGVVGWIGCFAKAPGVVCLPVDLERVIAAFVPFVLAGALFAGGIATGRMARAVEFVHRDELEGSRCRGP